MLVFGRQWATPASYGVFASSRGPATNNPGWFLANNAALAKTQNRVSDGTTNVFSTAIATYSNAGAAACVGIEINRTANTFKSITGTTVDGSASIAAVVSISSGGRPFRVGSDTTGAAGTFTEFEFRAAVVHRGLLTTQQLADINAYYQLAMA